MDQFERMKVTRQAMNGRMCLMFGGIFLMFSAITSTIMYGINFFMTALEADKGTAEYVELLENAGVGSGLLKGIGICFIAVGIWEAVVGFLSVRNSNRVDKSRFSVKLAISLLITEIVMQVILFFTGLIEYIRDIGITLDHTQILEKINPAQRFANHLVIEISPRVTLPETIPVPGYIETRTPFHFRVSQDIDFGIQLQPLV